jgi:hypothetical protein
VDNAQYVLPTLRLVPWSKPLLRVSTRLSAVGISIVSCLQATFLLAATANAWGDLHIVEVTQGVEQDGVHRTTKPYIGPAFLRQVHDLEDCTDRSD